MLVSLAQTATAATSLSDHFTLWDWGVVVAYLALTTWLGTALAGKQATIRDFFLGGRKLPWYAVSGSIVATEISAVTFVGVPAVVYAASGNFTYLQLGLIGTFLARIIVGYVLVPAYYQREIYSPYDYIGNQLGGNTRGVASALFALGGMLAQSARVYLTALVLTVVLQTQLEYLAQHVCGTPLGWAIVVITVVATIWTLIGGITTVIWTDVMLFLMFLLGAAAALWTVAAKIDGGLGTLWTAGWNVRYEGLPASEAPAWWDWGKFTFFDFTTRYPDVFTKPYTLIAAVIASTWGSLGPYGTDQLIVQRMFCCKNEREARWAIISSTAGQVVTFMVMVVGVGLYAFYQQHQMSPAGAELFHKDPDRVFPIFIIENVPVLLKGMVIAAIFAAAISSLTSILAALSQTMMSAFYLPLRQRALAARGVAIDATTGEDRHAVRVGRVFVLLWGVALALLAVYIEKMSTIFPEVLNLALALAGYAGGALLAGFFLGFLRLRIDGWGYQFAAPLSVFYIFAIVFHSEWSFWTCVGGGAALILLWVIRNIKAGAGIPKPVVPYVVQAIVLTLGLMAMLFVNTLGYFDVESTRNGARFLILQWPWYVPVGSTITFVLGYLLARRRTVPAG